MPMLDAEAGATYPWGYDMIAVVFVFLNEGGSCWGKREEERKELRSRGMSVAGTFRVLQRLLRGKQSSSGDLSQLPSAAGGRVPLCQCLGHGSRCRSSRQPPAANPPMPSCNAEKKASRGRLWGVGVGPQLRASAGPGLELAFSWPPCRPGPGLSDKETAPPQRSPFRSCTKWAPWDRNLGADRRGLVPESRKQRFT
jgi:hypothetical protein